MTDRLTFRVLGDPKPQGSKRVLAHGAVVESAGRPLKDWRHDVVLAATDELARADDFSPRDPVEVTIVFSLRRPQSHHVASSRENPLKIGAPMMHTQRPDVDKLLRAVLDALTIAGCVPDDAAIAYVCATKTWCDVGEQPGAYVSIVDIDHETKAAV
jgi:Holliday junction resolvase RusA-like endonuclease